MYKKAQVNSVQKKKRKRSIGLCTRNLKWTVLKKKINRTVYKKAQVNRVKKKDQ